MYEVNERQARVVSNETFIMPYECTIELRQAMLEHYANTEKPLKHYSVGE